MKKIVLILGANIDPSPLKKELGESEESMMIIGDGYQKLSTLDLNKIK